MPPSRAAILGSRWSLSNVLDPADVVLDAGSFNRVMAVDPAHYTQALVQRAMPTKSAPIVAQAGIQIGVLNEVLGKSGYALPTSGAADGHRLAGCISTGTHGAAWEFGAVHDAVLAGC